MYADASQFANLQRKHTPAEELYAQTTECDDVLELPTALQSVLVHATDPLDANSSVTSPLLDHRHLSDDAAVQYTRCTVSLKPHVGLSSI